MRVNSTLLISIKIQLKILAFSIKIIRRLLRKKFFKVPAEIPQKVMFCV